MARRDPVEERLAELASLRHEDDRDKVLAHLKSALTQKRSGLIVSRAAKMAVELGQGMDLSSLAPTLEEAFLRLADDPVKRDKGCLGKIELAKALVEWAHPAVAVFLRGIRTVQLEPVWGGSVDTAAALRGWCAHGLVRLRHSEAMLWVAPMLADAEKPARLAAAEALGDSGQIAAEAALRLKIAVGDDEPEVLGECFNSLLRLDPERSLSFVADYLQHADPTVVEAAALALGESRLEGGIDLLRATVERIVDGELQRSLYLALAMTRRQRALDFLTQEVEEAGSGRAVHALSALALHRHDETLCAELKRLVAERDSRELHRVWREQFES